MPVAVTMYTRRAAAGQHSVERLVRDIVPALPESVKCRIAESRFESRGVVARLYNVAEASVRQGAINHVMGDVHYLLFGIKGERTVLTVLDCVSLKRLRSVKRAIFKYAWMSVPVARAGIVCTISRFTRDELCKELGLPTATVRIVHCTVGREFAWAPQRFRPQKPVILQVGTKPNKNLLRVAEALSGLPCALQIVGRLEEMQRTALRAAAVQFEELGNVPTETLVEVYRKADLLLFASTYEGFGMPIVEAQCIGRPVVTANVTAMPEVAGEGACLVDPFSASAIREGVRRVIDDSAYRESLIAAGRENARRFSPEAIAGEYAAIYMELAAREG